MSGCGDRRGWVWVDSISCDIAQRERVNGRCRADYEEAPTPNIDDVASVGCSALLHVGALDRVPDVCDGRVEA